MNIKQANIDQSTHEQVVQNLIEKLRAYYIFPDIAEQICKRLQDHLQNGEYREITEGEFFAIALTEHLQEVNQDKHLWVRWRPEPLPDHDGSMLQNLERVEAWRQRARLDNYGIHKLERLPGNVGYIDIHYFYRLSWGSGDTAIAAMNFVANMHALIFDLRMCRGGNPGMVALFSSYLFGEEPVHLNSLYWREEDFTQQYWTLPYVPGRRFGDKPVYVLTSNATFSAGEEFTYNLKTRQRAIQVGETTGGGAHPGSTYRLQPHFEAFIPNGRAINPITNENWEGSGVLPDIPVPQEEALVVAHRMALMSILESIGEPDSEPFDRLVKEAQAALKDLD